MSYTPRIDFPESDTEEEIIRVVRKRKPKKRYVYIEDSNEDDELTYVQERQPQEALFTKNLMASNRYNYVQAPVQNNQVYYKRPQESNVQYVYQDDYSTNDQLVEYVYDNRPNQNLAYYQGSQSAETLYYQDSSPKYKPQQFAYGYYPY